MKRTQHLYSCASFGTHIRDDTNGYVSIKEKMEKPAPEVYDLRDQETATRNLV